jgi:hypothetical protein
VESAKWIVGTFQLALSERLIRLGARSTPCALPSEPSLEESVVFRFHQRLVISMTVLFLATYLSAAALVSTGPASLAVTGLAMLAIAALAGARYAAVVIRSREISVGGRAREHRDVVSMVPAPQHPSTPGRPRTRAPSLSAAVAQPSSLTR